MGAAVVLAVPLLLVAQLFERRFVAAETRATERLDEVRDEVRQEVDERIGALQEQFGQRLAEMRHDDEDAVTRARERASFENIRDLFDRASALAALSRHGLRVPLPDHLHRLRFQALNMHAQGQEPVPVLDMEVQTFDGAPTGVSVAWQEGETQVDAFAHLAERWQTAGSFPGDSILNPDDALGCLVESLDLAIRRRRAQGGEGQIAPLIEVTSDTWALTDFGLEHVARPDYAIESRDLVAKPDAIREHMNDKKWHNEEEERAEASGKPSFWETTEVAGSFFRRLSDRSRRFVS